MKRIRSTLAFLIFASLWGSPEDSLVPAGGFEGLGADLSPWKKDVGDVDAVFTLDSAVKLGGSAAVKAVVTRNDKVSWPNLFVKLSNLEAGQCFQGEAWIRTENARGGGGAYLAVDFLDEKGARLSFASSSMVSSTSDWRQVFLKAAAPSGAKSMLVKLILHGQGTAWFDDVKLSRDPKAEQAIRDLEKPLPADWLQRAFVSDGNLALLRRAFEKAGRGGAFTVGILGGSITQGASASGKDKHYSAYLTQWWKRNFPGAQVALVNAGIGATGSDYGAMRMARDLLSKNPDFIIVEYAVNDGNTQDKAESYEGVLRQILALPTKPGLLLLFMMNSIGSNAQEWQAKLGKHYGLPMVSYRDLLWPEVEAKRIAWRDLSPDAVHPNDIGHAYAGKLVCAMLDRARANGSASSERPLPAPLLTDAFQFCSLAEADSLTPLSNDGWAFDGAQAGLKCWKSAKPGSVIQFEMTGEKVFFTYYRVRGPMGKAKVSVDGGDPVVCDAWFDQTWGGYRQMIRLVDGKPGKHLVRVELLSEKQALSAGNEFRILCLGAAGVR